MEKISEALLGEQYRSITRRLIKRGQKEVDGKEVQTPIVAKDIFPGNSELLVDGAVHDYVSPETLQKINDFWNKLQEGIKKGYRPRKPVTLETPDGETIRRENLKIYGTTGNSIPGERRMFFGDPKEVLNEEEELAFVRYGNQYYEFTKLLFRANQEAVGKLLEAMLQDLSTNFPEPMVRNDTIRQIMHTQELSSSEKVKAILQKGSVPAEWGLLLLTAVLLTGGMYTILQWPEVTEYLKRIPEKDRALVQGFFVIVEGVVCSAIVVSTKNKVFQTIADTESVMQGVRKSMTDSPGRSVAMALCVAGGIYTGAEGIEKIHAVQSRHAVVAEHAHALKNEVGKIISASSEQGLPALHTQIRAAIAADTATFQRIPEDELHKKDYKGLSGPGVSYYTKKFVVEGGYKPNWDGVTHAVANDTNISKKKSKLPITKERDKVMKKSGIDFGPSLEKKFEALLQTYIAQSQKTEESIAKVFSELDSISQQKGNSVAGIKEFLSAPKDELEKLTQRVTRALEMQSQAYQSFRTSIQALEKQYLDFLQLVDPRTKYAEKYTLSGVPALPEDSAVGVLDARSIVQKKEELQNSVDQSERAIHLEFLGLMLLLSTLGITLVGRKVVAQKRKDDAKIPHFQEFLTEWEDAFIRQCDFFFGRADVQATLPGTNFPGAIAIRDAYYRTLAEVSKKHYREHWTGLPHSSAVKDYDRHTEAIAEFMQQKDIYFPKFIELLFPGLSGSRALDRRAFTKLSQFINAGQLENEAKFLEELEQLQPSQENKGLVSESESPKRENLAEDKILKREFRALQKQFGFSVEEEGEDISLLLWFKQSLLPLQSFVRAQFVRLRASRKEASASSPLLQARQKWMQQLNTETLQWKKAKIDISKLFPFLFAVMQVHIPHIREHQMGPLRAILKEFPEIKNQVVESPEYWEQQIEEIEKEIFNALGVAQVLSMESRPGERLYPRSEHIVEDCFEGIIGETMEEIAESVSTKVETIRNTLQIILSSAKEV